MSQEEPSNFQFSSSDSSAPRSSLSLALLFYIVTTGGIISACLSFLSGNENLTGIKVAIVLGVGATVGLVLGVIVGTLQVLRPVAGFIGGVVGVVLGLIGGSLTLIEPEQFLKTSAICFGGCFLLVASILLVARFQHDPSLKRVESNSASAGTGSQAQ